MSVETLPESPLPLKALSEYAERAMDSLYKFQNGLVNSRAKASVEILGHFASMKERIHEDWEGTIEFLRECYTFAGDVAFLGQAINDGKAADLTAFLLEMKRMSAELTNTCARLLSDSKGHLVEMVGENSQQPSELTASGATGRTGAFEKVARLVVTIRSISPRHGKNKRSSTADDLWSVYPDGNYDLALAKVALEGIISALTTTHRFWLSTSAYLERIDNNGSNSWRDSIATEAKSWEGHRTACIEAVLSLARTCDALTVDAISITTDPLRPQRSPPLTLKSATTTFLASRKTVLGGSSRPSPDPENAPRTPNRKVLPAIPTPSDSPQTTPGPAASGQSQLSNSDIESFERIALENFALIEPWNCATSTSSKGEKIIKGIRNQCTRYYRVLKQNASLIQRSTPCQSLSNNVLTPDPVKSVQKSYQITTKTQKEAEAISKRFRSVSEVINRLANRISSEEKKTDGLVAQAPYRDEKSHNSPKKTMTFKIPVARSDAAFQEQKAQSDIAELQELQCKDAKEKLNEMAQGIVKLREQVDSFWNQQVMILEAPKNVSTTRQKGKPSDKAGLQDIGAGGDESATLYRRYTEMNQRIVQYATSLEAESLRRGSKSKIFENARKKVGAKMGQ